MMNKLFDFFGQLFDTSGYVRRGYCGGWSKSLATMQNASDLAIWAAYLAIPIVLFYFARRRPNLPLPQLFWMFGLFILSCGTSHLMTYVTTMFPAYRLETLIKVITAVASWGTVFAIAVNAPIALSMRMPSDLEREISLREEAQMELAPLNESLSDRTERLEELNGELEGFNHLIAHDLRAPLRNLVIGSQMLIEDAPEEMHAELKSRLARLSKQALHMAHLMDDLLDFSRLGSYTLKPTRVDLSEQTIQIYETLRSTYPSATISVEPGLTIEADPKLTQLMLSNLLENAFKYSATDRPAHAHVGRRMSANGDAFFVADNGRGFSMDYAEQIFKPFERLQGAEIEGTGIGLANVRRIAKLHAGNVWAESEPGSGSTFFFQFGTSKSDSVESNQEASII